METVKYKDLKDIEYKTAWEYQEERFMITLSQLTELLGWASVINIAYLILATLIITFMKSSISSIYLKLFDLDKQTLNSKYFDFLSMYKIATLVSLSLTPLKIEKINSINIDNDQVNIKGSAILFESGIYAKVPEGMDEHLVLAALDVAGAPAQVNKLVKEGDQVQAGQVILVLDNTQQSAQLDASLGIAQPSALAKN